MTQPSLTHDTLTIERVLSAAPARVFAAYADPQLRAQWTVPADDQVLRYLEADFRTDGIDRFRCGPRADPVVEGEVRYVDIVPDRRIVYSESLSTGGSLIAVSLISWELLAAGPGCRLVVTDQVTSLMGREPIEGSAAGYAAAVGNLETYLHGSHTSV